MKPDTPIADAFRLKKDQKDALARLGISTVFDLLYFFPSRYNNIADITRISDLKKGDAAIVYGKIERIKTVKAFRKNIPLAEATVSDGINTVRAVWFHQAYMAKMLHEGDFVKLSGTVGESKGKPYLQNPQFEKTKYFPIDAGNSIFGTGQTEAWAHPVYGESAGITSRWIFYAVKKALSAGVARHIPDPIPPEMRKKYHLPSLALALAWVHAPRKESESKAARKRFAFEEIFFIQLARLRQKAEYEKNPAFACSAPIAETTRFIKKFPFPLTGAQKKCIDSILSDIGSHSPMSRLLEGDVGSGKTAVAAVTAHAVVSSRPDKQDFGNLQVAYMAPTEILASQLFDSFIQYFGDMGIQVGLITGSGCRKFPSKVGYTRATGNGSAAISRTQLLKWVANGEIPILVGTHSLIQKTVRFKDLACVIIDEQHRFGTKQRMKLVRKDWTHGTDGVPRAPHLLSMTATPIPRTLALTIYGDLDLSVLDEMPKGRLPVITEIIAPKDRERMYRHIKKELASGRQAYVICPRIDDPDPEKTASLNVKSVKNEATHLQASVFKEYVVEALHGKMKPAEKDTIMKKFERGAIHVLVSTSVVEVGVNVPNATIIVIEGAERFGLAQLHQLRGRVIRGAHQAYCYIFSDTKNEKTATRLRALTKAKNGFELAEIDLEFRGAGELSGGKQWGVSDVGMEGIKNIKMVEAARTEATALLRENPTLDRHPLIRERADRQDRDIHFE